MPDVDPSSPIWLPISPPLLALARLAEVESASWYTDCVVVRIASKRLTISAGGRLVIGELAAQWPQPVTDRVAVVPASQLADGARRGATQLGIADDGAFALHADSWADLEEYEPHDIAEEGLPPPFQDILPNPRLVRPNPRTMTPGEMESEARQVGVVNVPAKSLNRLFTACGVRSVDVSLTGGKNGVYAAGRAGVWMVRGLLFVGRVKPVKKYRAVK